MGGVADAVLCGVEPFCTSDVVGGGEVGRTNNLGGGEESAVAGMVYKVPCSSLYLNILKG